jgi:hypothetical protein
VFRIRIKRKAFPETLFASGRSEAIESFESSTQKCIAIHLNAVVDD